MPLNFELQVSVQSLVLFFIIAEGKEYPFLGVANTTHTSNPWISPSECVGTRKDMEDPILL